MDWTVQVAADRGKFPGIRLLSHRCEAVMANLVEFTAAADACLALRLTLSAPASRKDLVRCHVAGQAFSLDQ